MIKIGIVGHRFFASEEVAVFVYDQCKLLLEVKKKSSKLTVLSAIAEGADSLFAEAAISLNIPLEIVIPFEKYIEDFEEERAKKKYLGLIEAASKETVLPFTHRSEGAYMSAMDWIVSHSDLLIAVWDGQKGNSGTAYAVQKMINGGQDWIHVNVAERHTKFYLNETLP